MILKYILYGSIWSKFVQNVLQIPNVLISSQPASNTFCYLSQQKCAQVPRKNISGTFLNFYKFLREMD
jgi:hypothetical protein